ncbi:hypothetical protein JTE90_017226 [Oedothorax gibbosus]|uniref:Uncharacterized protein n=1 Tax=Oedothorax gibbosus TaxID=931172 RepID=A0AAV6VDV4_9ARAC|nr:hypothetical protein JTE90_017226 [Oedothorax gibbosus]
MYRRIWTFQFFFQLSRSICNLHISSQQLKFGWGKYRELGTDVLTVLSLHWAAYLVLLYRKETDQCDESLGHSRGGVNFGNPHVTVRTSKNIRDSDQALY